MKSPDFDAIIAAFSKKKPTNRGEKAREILGKPFVKLFDNGQMPIPEFHQVEQQPRERKARLPPGARDEPRRTKTQNEDGVQGRYVFDGFVNGRKSFKFIPDAEARQFEKPRRIDTSAYLNAAKVGRFQTDPVRVQVAVEEIKTPDEDFPEVPIVPILFVVSYGFGSTVEEYIADHKAMCHDFLKLFQYLDVVTEKTRHTRHGLEVLAMVPYHKFTELYNRFDFDGQSVYVTDELIQYLAQTHTF